MEANAGMLATLFERSMGLGGDWAVTDVRVEEPEGGRAELHVRVGRAPGRAVACPVCGGRCGVYDTRERTWRHLDIWQYPTFVHCAVPRADCPEHGPRTVLMPWEVRPNSHFTALFEAQVLLMALNGMTASAIAAQVGESDSRVWGMLRRAVSQARAAADYSGVVRVGVDDTARARGQNYVSLLCDLDGRRVVGFTPGRDRGAPGRLCDQLEERGGDRAAVREVTRDMAEAYSLGCAEAMPNAAQTVDRFHVMQLFSKATDRVRLAEARSSEQRRAQLKGTKYCWLKRPENLTERRAERKASLMGEHLLTARACAMTEAMRAVYACPGREELGGAGPGAELDHALQRRGDEAGGQDRAQGARGRAQLVLEQVHQRLPGGRQLRGAVHQEGRAGLQEPGLLRDDGVPEARGPGLLVPDIAALCYPLKVTKSLKIGTYHWAIRAVYVVGKTFPFCRKRLVPDALCSKSVRGAICFASSW